MLAVDSTENVSKSPQKPRMLLEFLARHDLDRHFVRHDGWPPFGRQDFLLAHTPEYVDAFFAGRPRLCKSNGLAWSEQFADSVRYTNSSLYHAIEHAVTHPDHVTFSPTSGFHHARPTAGSGFCTFSGQVIAAIKIFREHRLVGAHLDLDGHFGNSIEDSRNFVPDLNQALPPGCNINPDGDYADYLDSVKENLAELEVRLARGEVNYVVFAHGADSHEADDLGGQPSWAPCSIAKCSIGGKRPPKTRLNCCKTARFRLLPRGRGAVDGSLSTNQQGWPRRSGFFMRFPLQFRLNQGSSDRRSAAPRVKRR